MTCNNVIYFDSFAVEIFQKKSKNSYETKNIIANIYRIQAYDLIMRGHFYNPFIDYILEGKILPGYTNLFSPNEYEKM